MREVHIGFSGINGDGVAAFLIDVGGSQVEFDGSADRLAIRRALEEFDKKHAIEAINSISVRPTAQHVLKP